MAIDERPDGQMMILIAFVTGLVIAGVVGVAACCWIATSGCPKKDCSQEVAEYQSGIMKRDNTIKRLEVYEQAVKWRKK